MQLREVKCIRMHMWLMILWLLFSSCCHVVFTACRTLSMLFPGLVVVVLHAAPTTTVRLFLHAALTHYRAALAHKAVFFVCGNLVHVSPRW